jgi:putative copper resistance protein D
MDLDAALIACRWLHYVAAVSLFGTSAFLEVLVPTGLAKEIERRLSPLLVAAIGLAAATTLLWLPLEAGEIGEGWSDVFDLDMVSSVLTDSSFGHVWQWRLAIAGGLILLPALWPGYRWSMAALFSGLLLASLAFVGHAAMQEGIIGALHRGNHIIHLLSAAAWLGALVPLVPCIAALGDPALQHAASLALRRFSTVGHAAVALVVMTGATNTALILGRWPTDWSSPYQALLAAKIGCVAMMILLALINRYVIVARMKAAPETSKRHLVAGAMAELLLGAVVLALVSVFGTFEPA